MEMGNLNGVESIICHHKTGDHKIIEEYHWSV
jgi:hypothetical protein